MASVLFRQMIATSPESGQRPAKASAASRALS